MLKHEDLRKQTVLIAGGISGIGEVTALAFAKEGANVVISGRRVSEDEKVAGQINGLGGRGLFVQRDVAQEEDIAALIEKTLSTFGALHITFNNAGTEGRFGPLITEQTVEHYRQVCDVNILGVFTLNEAPDCRHAAERWRLYSEQFFDWRAHRISSCLGMWQANSR